MTMLDLLSRQWHQDGSKKDKDSPLKTSSSETGFHEGEDAVKYTAAYQRMEYVTQVNLRGLSALRYQQFIADEAEAAALHGPIDQYWAIFDQINENTAALAIAHSRGRDIDFDTKFWQKHKHLLQQLPVNMWQDEAAVDSDTSADEKLTGDSPPYEQA